MLAENCLGGRSGRSGVLRDDRKTMSFGVSPDREVVGTRKTDRPCATAADARRNQRLCARIAADIERAAAARQEQAGGDREPSAGATD